MKSSQFVAYVRVSTDGQGKSGLGLEAQPNAVQSFLPVGAVILSEFIEVESGKKADRPELAKAIALAKQTKSTLLIAKLDRLARNVAFIANLLDGDIDVVAADMPQAQQPSIRDSSSSSSSCNSSRVVGVVVAREAAIVILGMPLRDTSGIAYYDHHHHQQQQHHHHHHHQQHHQQ